MIELVLLPSIREQVEQILTKQIGAELTETTPSFLWEKKMLNKICKDLDNIDWEQLWEGMKEKVDGVRWELREKLEKWNREVLKQKLLTYKWSAQSSYDYFMKFKQWNKETSAYIKWFEIGGKKVADDILTFENAWYVWLRSKVATALWVTTQDVTNFINNR